MLVFNVSYLAIIPALCIDKIQKGAYSIPVAPVPLGTWIGTTSLPKLVNLPEEALPLPIFEVMELMLGWLNLAACVLSSRGYIMVNGQRCPGHFFGRTAVGEDMSARLGLPNAHAKLQ